jgi:hypothetical protein
MKINPRKTGQLETLHSYKTLIIGGYPPPMGGVTIHIKRFYEYCRLQDFPVKIITQFRSVPQNDGVRLVGPTPIGKLIHLLLEIIKFSGEIIHFHASHLNKLSFGGLPILYAARSKLRLLTIHTDVTVFPRKKNLKYRMMRLILGKFNYIICINEKQIEYFRTWMRLPDKKLVTIPSYIPLQKPPGNNSLEIKKFVNVARAQVDYLLISSGYLLNIYGYDLIIDAVNRITDKRIGIIFAFYTTEDDSYKKYLDSKITLLKHVWTFQDISSDDFFYLIRESDLFIRANREDTYGMVIGDALKLGTPVIASDFCPRHRGSILFKTGDALDLQTRIETTLGNLDQIRTQLDNLEQENYGIDLLNFYKSIMK